MFLGTELDTPLLIKWQLSDADLQKRGNDLKEYWKETVGLLRKAKDRAATGYDVGPKQILFKVGNLLL